MSAHPSLSAPRIPLGKIHPQRTMKPNSHCWCGSGVKWKKCHRERESQTPINYFAHAAALRETFASGFCCYVDQTGVPCSGAAIASHTVQRNGGLAAIQENGHVLTTKFTPEDLKKSNGVPQIRRVGTKKASTFPGFCNKHDTEVFRPIEDKSAPFDKRAALLYSYRATAYEYFAKKAAVDLIPLQREMDKGASFEKQVEVQLYLSTFADGLKLGLRDAMDWKSRYDKLLHSNDLSQFNYYAAFFDGVAPLVACASWQVETDFQGRTLQMLARQADEFEPIAFNLTSIGGETVAIFGWIGAKSGPSHEFVESFKSIPPHRRMSIIANMAFEQSENVLMRESWWNGLNIIDKHRLHDRILSGTPSKGRHSEALWDDGSSAISATFLREEEG